MAVYFMDSSGVAKRYIAETGSTWINHLLASNQHNTFRIARITGVEVIAAIVRRSRGGLCHRKVAHRPLRNFMRSLGGFF
jgi:uncharacterized protein